MKILLIEDDSFIAEFEKEIFADHEVVVVNNLHDAFSQAIMHNAYKQFGVGKFDPFDLVILDLRLPIKHKKSPNKMHVDAQFHQPEYVLQAISDRFANIPIVVISAFLTEDLINVATSHNMICIDKHTIAKTRAFLNNVYSGMELSRKMRLGLVSHLTTHAAEVALTDTAQCVPVKTDPDDPRPTLEERTKARCYLIGMTFACGVPTILILFQMYTRIVFGTAESLPFTLYIYFFCGMVIAGVFGLLPWFMKFLPFGKGGGDTHIYVNGGDKRKTPTDLETVTVEAIDNESTQPH